MPRAVSRRFFAVELAYSAADRERITLAGSMRSPVSEDGRPDLVVHRSPVHLRMERCARVGWPQCAPPLARYRCPACCAFLADHCPRLVPQHAERVTCAFTDAHSAGRVRPATHGIDDLYFIYFSITNEH